MKKLILAGIVMFSLAAVPTDAHASTPATQFAVCSSGANNFFGFQPWYACLEQKYGGVRIESLNDIFLIIFPAVEWLVKAGALVAAFIIFFLLIQMMYARGDAGKIATAGMGIRDAIIGFIICLASVAIINFIAGAFIAQ